MNENLGTDAVIVQQPDLFYLGVSALEQSNFDWAMKALVGMPLFPLLTHRISFLKEFG